MVVPVNALQNRTLAILLTLISLPVGCADAIGEQGESHTEDAPGWVGQGPVVEVMPRPLVVPTPIVERAPYVVDSDLVADQPGAFPAGHGILTAAVVTLPPAATAEASCEDYELVESLTVAQIETQRVAAVENILQQAHEVCPDDSYILMPRRVEEDSVYVSAFSGCDAADPVTELYAAMLDVEYLCLGRLDTSVPTPAQDLGAQDDTPLYERIWHPSDDDRTLRIEPVEESCEGFDCCLEAGAGRGYCSLLNG